MREQQATLSCRELLHPPVRHAIMQHGPLYRPPGADLLPPVPLRYLQRRENRQGQRFNLHKLREREVCERERNEFAGRPDRNRLRSMPSGKVLKRRRGYLVYALSSGNGYGRLDGGYEFGTVHGLQEVSGDNDVASGAEQYTNANPARLTCFSRRRGKYAHVGYQEEDAECMSCAIGYYAENTKSTECTKCGPGQTTLNTETNSSKYCENCKVGQYQESGSGTCSTCRVGKVREDEKQCSPFDLICH